MPVGDIDPLQVGSLGLGGVVLGLVFRTLWRQDAGWRSVLDAARSDAADARADAAAARADVAAARSAEAMCRDLIAQLERRIRELEARNDRHPED